MPPIIRVDWPRVVTSRMPRPGQLDARRSVMKAWPNIWYIPQIITIGAPSDARPRRRSPMAARSSSTRTLTGVLPAAAHEQVRVRGERHTRVVVVDDAVVAVPTNPGGQAPGVAQVAVDRHLARVEVDQGDPALGGEVGGMHSPSCRSRQTEARGEERRSAIIAV
jgi:hypothetical protein